MKKEHPDLARVKKTVNEAIDLFASKNMGNELRYGMLTSDEELSINITVVEKGKNNGKI